MKLVYNTPTLFIPIHQHDMSLQHKAITLATEFVVSFFNVPHQGFVQTTYYEDTPLVVGVTFHLVTNPRNYTVLSMYVFTFLDYIRQYLQDNNINDNILDMEIAMNDQMLNAYRIDDRTFQKGKFILSPFGAIRSSFKGI